MRSRSFVLVCGWLLIAGEIPQVRAQAVDVVFLEPVEEAAEQALPAYRRIDDPERLATYRGWLESEASLMALELYADAIATMRERGEEPTAGAYHVALVPDGNHADAGFRLVEADGSIVERPGTMYIKLAPQAFRFESTILHETGHVVLGILNGGEGIPTEPLVSIPHTTAALTDRGTAFNEGYAIHLETLLAHFGETPGVLSKYRRDQLLFGPFPGWAAEYYRASADIGTYAQTAARWSEVRENAYAFTSAHDGPDYLRVQLEKARDAATLRNANQLLQSEGFYATFFYGLAVRGAERPDRARARERQRETLAVLAHTLAAVEADPETPWLVEVLDAWREIRPETYPEVLDAFLDLTRGVFVDPTAKRLWRDHYMAMLRLDLENRNREAIEAARARWREAVLADPAILRSRLGPAVPCVVESVTVELVAFGANPLYFDANTAEEGVVRMVPGIRDETVTRWLGERDGRPFASAGDLRERVRPGPVAAAAIACGSDVE